MTFISGKFYWNDDLPDDEEVENAPEPRHSADFGEQWQYMAIKPVIHAICDAMRHQELVTDVSDPSPEDLGWYSQFRIGGWKCIMLVHWAPEDHCENAFEFMVQLQHDWFHRLIHRSQYTSHVRALGSAIARVFASTPAIERAIFNPAAS